MLYCTCPERKDVIAVDFCGLQKLTLLDYPGKVACTVFLQGCNFRCPFCHNSQLLGGDAEELMDSSALLDFLGKRRGVLDGVCITGGEPLMQIDFLIELFTEAKKKNIHTCIDTSGIGFNKDNAPYIEKYLEIFTTYSKIIVR